MTITEILSFWTIQRFLKDFGTKLVTGDSDGIARLCIYPLAMYTPVTLRVFRQAEDMVRYTDAFSNMIRARGVVVAQPNELTVLDATDKRAFVSTCWDFVTEDGEVLSQNRVQYVLRADCGHDSMQIELVDYGVVAFPDFVEQQFHAN